MFDRYTDRYRKVMALARRAARTYGQDCIGTEHILLGVLQAGSGVTVGVLRNVGAEIRKIREEMEQQMPSGSRSRKVKPLVFTPSARKALDVAMEEADGLRHHYIGTEHLLLALLRESDGLAARVLLDLRLPVETARAEVLKLLGSGTTLEGAPTGCMPSFHFNPFSWLKPLWKRPKAAEPHEDPPGKSQ